MNESDIADFSDAPGIREDEIKITPQMIEAGFAVLRESGIADEYLEADKCTVADIYRAMSALRPHPFNQRSKTARST